MQDELKVYEGKMEKTLDLSLIHILQTVSVR